jgi:hypothetical protein
VHIDQNQIATELVVALGQLGKAQELGADDTKLSDLAARVRYAGSNFTILFGYSYVALSYLLRLIITPTAVAFLTAPGFLTVTSTERTRSSSRQIFATRDASASTNP